MTCSATWAQTNLVAVRSGGSRTPRVAHPVREPVDGRRRRARNGFSRRR